MKTYKIIKGTPFHLVTNADYLLTEVPFALHEDMTLENDEVYFTECCECGSFQYGSAVVGLSEKSHLVFETKDLLIIDN